MLDDKKDMSSVSVTQNSRVIFRNYFVSSAFRRTFQVRTAKRMH